MFRKVKEYITRRDVLLHHLANIETPWTRLGAVSFASESHPAISDRQLLGWVKLSLEVGRSKHSPLKLRNECLIGAVQNSLPFLLVSFIAHDQQIKFPPALYNLLNRSLNF